MSACAYVELYFCGCRFHILYNFHQFTVYPVYRSTQHNSADPLRVSGSCKYDLARCKYVLAHCKYVHDFIMLYIRLAVIVLLQHGGKVPDLDTMLLGLCNTVP